MPWLDTAPGARLHWQAAGRGRPVVLVHGWSMSSRAFSGQLEALSATAQVVAIDLRGHGRSPPVPAPPSVEDHARDLASAFDALELRGAILIGWSMGGQIALESIPRLGDRLAGLVLLSTTPCFTARHDWPHGLPASSVRALATRLERRPEPTLRRFFDGMFVEGELTEELRAEVLRRSYDGGREGLTDADRDARLAAARDGLRLLLEADQRPRLDAVRVPTLVLHGERDPVCLPGAAAFAAARIAGARHEVVPGAGHAPHLSRPEETNALLARFAAEPGA